jgi:hypothetical protein
MELITFAKIKEKYHLGQAQAIQVCARANYKKMAQGHSQPIYKYDPVEIAMIVKNIKNSLTKGSGKNENN